MSTKCGAELIAHHITLTLESNPNWIVLKSNVKNAFNSVSRDQIMELVSLTFPDSYNHVISNVWQTQLPCLHAGFGSSTVIIPSEEEVHQGDHLGPVHFATAIHPVLTKIQKSHSQVYVLPYLDDVFLLRGTKSVLAAFHDLKETFSAINLVIADKKCEIFSPSSSTAVEEFEGIPVSCESALFLGSPIGSMSFATSSCATIGQSKPSLCDQLTKLDDVQSAMLLL